MWRVGTEESGGGVACEIGANPGHIYFGRMVGWCIRIGHDCDLSGVYVRDEIRVSFDASLL
jgi:hypothetical protein